LRHFFKYPLVGELEYRFSQFRMLRSQTFLNLQEGDYVMQLEFRSQPRDAMTWTSGSDLVGGPTGSFLGFLARNDRIGVSLSLHLPQWLPGKARARALASAGERP
jgi:hypothetical protein